MTTILHKRQNRWVNDEENCRQHVFRTGKEERNLRTSSTTPGRYKISRSTVNAVLIVIANNSLNPCGDDDDDDDWFCHRIVFLPVLLIGIIISCEWQTVLHLVGRRDWSQPGPKHYQLILRVWKCLLNEELFNNYCTKKLSR